MAVFYRLHQDQSTGTKRSGKWYARAVPTAVIGTRQLAEIIQRNCTVKKSDVMAVLEELVEVMDRHRVEGCTDRRQVLRQRARQGSARRLHA